MINIERYKQLEQQIEWIKTELKKGEYKAAGVELYLNIGQLDVDYGMRFSFGIYSGIEQELLELILKGLIETQKYVLMDIQKDFEEITKLLETI